MKKLFIALIALVCGVSAFAAYQFETRGNQGWLTFDSETTVGFDLTRSGKDKDHENFIDRGNGVADYGWYNINTGETGSFSNGATATFSADDRIGLYIRDNDGQVFRSTKSDGEADLGDDVLWGKSRLVDGGIAVAGGNMGSHGTHEFYVFKVNTENTSGKTPSGQPLPGVFATLIIGGGTALYLKKRKKLYASSK